MPRKENKTMARKPMVTRTLLTTKANVLCLNITTGEAENKLVTVPRTYKDNKALLKAVAPIVEADENLKAVHIVDTEVIETLYGMTEQEFMERATVLPPRTVAQTDDEE